MALSLQLRINLISLLSTTFVALVLTGLGGSFLFRQQAGNAIQRASQAAETLGSNAESLLALRLKPEEFAGFEEVTALTLRGNPMIESAGLRTPDGRLLYTTRRSETPSPSLLSHLLGRMGSAQEMLRFPVRDTNGEIRAWAELLLDRRAMFDYTADRVLLLLLSAAGLFALCVLLQQLIFWRMVGQPLSQLMNAVDAIQPERLEHAPAFPQAPGDDDIGRLYRALGGLLQRLTDTRQALIVQNERLEQTVSERTRELQRVNAELAQDIERRKQLEQELRTLASTDALTGLANRAFILPYIERRLAQARRDDSVPGLMSFDFDGFKAVNDRYGHAVGDRVLQHMARRISQICRQSDVLARLGGDEFLLIFDAQDEAQALILGQRVEAQFDTPLDLGHVSIRLGVSIGIALFPRHGETLEALMMHSDTAMYAAKQAGGGIRMASARLDA